MGLMGGGVAGTVELQSCRATGGMSQLHCRVARYSGALSAVVGGGGYRRDSVAFNRLRGPLRVVHSWGNFAVRVLCAV